MTATLDMPALDVALAPRWTPMVQHSIQQALWRCGARFIVIPSGRRSGKTEIAKRKLVWEAINFYAADDGRFVAAAPTREQAKRIFWKDLQKLVPDRFLAASRRDSVRESDLTIWLWNGAHIQVMGMDAPERIEGGPLDGVVLDEFGNMLPHVWKLHVQPALYTVGRPPGWAWLIGVPEGRNHYYDRYTHALSGGAAGEWAAFTWISADILPPEEIAARKAELDERTYRQEYEGRFETFTGRAYYTYEAEQHAVERISPWYDKRAPLIVCFDFNVAPGVAAVCQELEYKGANGDCPSIVTCVIGEVWVENYSNTAVVCRKLIHDWGTHEGLVELNGDATGGARGSAKTSGSDWDIIENTLRPVFGARLLSRVPKANPTERARVNAVNARLKAADGTVSLLIDPVKAKHVHGDLDGVRIKEGSAGELEKTKSPQLTHISDALGYYIVRRFPLRKGRLLVKELL